MSAPDPNAPPPASGSMAGCALFSIGLLLVIPSGLCTAVGGIGLVTQLLTDPRSLAGDAGALLPLGLLTLGSLAAGIALIRTALRVRKN